MQTNQEKSTKAYNGKIRDIHLFVKVVSFQYRTYTGETHPVLWSMNICTTMNRYNIVATEKMTDLICFCVGRHSPGAPRCNLPLHIPLPRHKFVKPTLVVYSNLHAQRKWCYTISRKKIRATKSFLKRWPSLDQKQGVRLTSTSS